MPLLKQYQSRILENALMTTVGFFLLYVGKNLLLPVLKMVEKEVSPSTLMTTIILLLVILVMGLAYTISLLKKYKTKLLYLFGVYWNNKLQIYCPVCKNPTMYEKSSKDCDVYCVKCQKEIRLRNEENHSNIPIHEAKKIVKEKLSKN